MSPRLCRTSAHRPPLAPLAVLGLVLIAGCKGSEPTNPGNNDDTPPFVSQWSPETDATGVPVNTVVTVTFSEPVQQGTVTSGSFTLSGPGGPVNGGVSLSGTTATFTPSSPLAGATRYTARVAGTVKDAAGNSMSGEFSWMFTTVETTPPTVTATAPGNGDAGVEPEAAVTVTFSEPVDPATVNTSTFLLDRSGSAGAPAAAGPSAVAVAGNVSVSGSTATFTPSAPLEGGSLYTARLTTDVRDLAGNALAAQYSWTFTTRETTPPTVTSTSPLPGATGVPTGTDVTATFSEALTASTVSPSSFTLSGPSGGVIGNVSLSGTTATFDPLGDLAPGATYTAHLTTAIEDQAGNALAEEVSWSFTTAEPVRPTVTATTPVSGATGVDVDFWVTATFSDDLDPSTVSSSTFTLTGPSGSVGGSATASGATVTFDPTSPLDFNTTYTARLTTGIHDKHGVGLATAFTWSFTTAAAPVPAVVSTTPADGATGVDVGVSVVAVFSQAMSPASLTTTTFTLTGPGGLVPATVSTSGSTATLNPSTDLSPGEQYTVRLATGVQSQAGAALSAEVTWAFITAAPDAPSITGLVPAQGASNVDVNTQVKVTLDQPVSNLTSMTLTLTGPSGDVSGSIGASGSSVTFTPNKELKGNTNYQATFSWQIATGGTNTGGGLGWVFTTQPNPLTVVNRSPSPGGSNVGIESPVSVAFSAIVDPATVSTATFVLSGPEGQVAGSFNVSGSTVTFTPSQPLTELGTSYSVTLKTGLQDMVGNALGSQTSWSFTTVIVDSNYTYRLTNLYLPDQYLDTFADTKGCYMTTSNTSGSYWRFRPTGLGDGSMLMSNDFWGPDQLLEGGDGSDRCFVGDPAPPGSVYTGQAWHLVSTAPLGYPGHFRLQNVNLGSGKSLDTPLVDGNAFPYMADTGPYSGQFWTLVRGYRIN